MEEFQEIYLSGGKIEFKKGPEGGVSTGYSCSNPWPMSMFQVCISFEGEVLDTVRFGGIGQTIPYSVSLTAMNGAGSDTEVKSGYISTGSCGNLPVRVRTIFHSSLQGAYDDPATLTGDTIESQAVTFAADVDLWRDMAVTFAGGNNCEFAAQAMGSTIDGSLTISNGSVVLSNVRIR